MPLASSIDLYLLPTEVTTTRQTLALKLVMYDFLFELDLVEISAKRLDAKRFSRLKPRHDTTSQRILPPSTEDVVL